MHNAMTFKPYTQNSLIKLHGSSIYSNLRIFNPLEFRDALVAGLDKCRGKLEASWTFLESTATQMEYRRHGELLFDILIFGGLLDGNGNYITTYGPNGHVKTRTNHCLLTLPRNDLATIRIIEQLIARMIKRYKSLHSAFDNEIRKLMNLLGNFDEEARLRLARLTALCLLNSTLTARCLKELGSNELNIEKGYATAYLIEVLRILKEARGVFYIIQTLQCSKLDAKVLELMPTKIRSEFHMGRLYLGNNLTEVVRLHRLRVVEEMKNDLHQMFADDIEEEIPHMDVERKIRQFIKENNLDEYIAVEVMWNVIMALGAWSRRETLVGEQALRLLETYCPLLRSFTQAMRAQVALLLKVQSYCADNEHFRTTFARIVEQLRKADVITNEAILIWYNEEHSNKCKDTFRAQIGRYVEELEAQKVANVPLDTSERAIALAQRASLEAAKKLKKHSNNNNNN